MRKCIVLSKWTYLWTLAQLESELTIWVKFIEKYNLDRNSVQQIAGYWNPRWLHHKNEHQIVQKPAIKDMGVKSVTFCYAGRVTKSSRTQKNGPVFLSIKFDEAAKFGRVGDSDIYRRWYGALMMMLVLIGQAECSSFHMRHWGNAVVKIKCIG